jgi:hypothetical protein
MTWDLEMSIQGLHNLQFLRFYDQLQAALLTYGLILNDIKPNRGSLNLG